MLGWPQVGNASFAITCTAAPPNASGAVFLGTGSLESRSPLALLGLRIWLNPSASQLVGSPAGSDARGAGELGLAIPPSPSLTGARLFAQWVWVGPNSPGPCPAFGLSASNALEVIVQS